MSPPAVPEPFCRQVLEFYSACERLGVSPTPFLFLVDITAQSAALLEGASVSPHPAPLPKGEGAWQSAAAKVESQPNPRTANLITPSPRGEGWGEGERDAQSKYQFLRAFRCSTSKFGIGQTAGSNCTPLGLHRIAEKIGDGCPVGTIFKARKAVGQVPPGVLDPTAITTRILWLEGLEPGFNRSGDVDTHARYIYIHGTGDETTLGRPASHGCIHLAAEDLIPFFDTVPVGTLVWIQEN